MKTGQKTYIVSSPKKVFIVLEMTLQRGKSCHKKMNDLDIIPHIESYLDLVKA